MSKIIIPNREAWLTEIATKMTPMIEEAAKEVFHKEMVMPPLRISMGFPSTRGLSAKRRRVGECWTGKATADGSFTVLISPVLSDVMEIAETVAHEAVHACVGVEHGHRKPFVDVVRKIGLIGKPTSTEPGPEFIKLVQPMIEDIGFTFPHAQFTAHGHYKKQPTRLIKVSCPKCGYICRTTDKWLEFGAPLCPTHMKEMKEDK